MKPNLLLLCGAMLLTYSIAAAQDAMQVRVLDSEVIRDGDRLNIAIAVDFNPLILHPHDQLVVTPLIVNGHDSVVLDPMVFNGATAERMEERAAKLYGTDATRVSQFYETLVFNKRGMREKQRSLRRGEAPPADVGNVMTYNASVPYQPWMAEAELMLEQEYYGCHGMVAYNLDKVGMMSRPVNAMVMFIVPEYEMPRRGTRDITAHVNFEVNKSQVKPDFMNNAEELGRIYDFTGEMIEDDDLGIEKIRIKGYASPEASYEYNDRLASARVDALQKNLEARFGLAPEVFEVEHVAEDWDSLRSWIEASDLKYRTQLLAIIDDTPDPDARDAKIRALDNGATYNMLLTQVYPDLRRVDYSIDYTVAPFTAERGREMVKNSPNDMTLTQYYFVADSYDPRSPEWIEVYTIAVGQYPRDPVCCNNVAAMAIMKGDNKTAKTHLERAKDDPRCLNNLGIVYLREGNTHEAEKLFRTAADEGSHEAAFNLANLHVLR